MRIGVDARELVGRATGVGRYLAELLAQWSRDPVAAADTLVLFSHVPLTLPEGLIGTGGARIEARVIPGSGSPVWEQLKLGFAARSQVDVLFCPGYSGPLLPGVPLAVTLHDVSFCAHPEWFRPREGWRRRLTAWAAAHRARRVLAVSSFSRDEIVRLLGVPVDKIRVIPQGVGGFFDPARVEMTPSEQAASLASAETAAPPSASTSISPAASASPTPVWSADASPVQLEPAQTRAGRAVAVPARGDAAASRVTPPAREPLVLFVGSIFNRRHVPLLLRAFTPIARDTPGARLVIVGDNRTFPHEDLDALAAQLGITPQVRMAKYVTDPELTALYREARAFVFLSEYEGFGLTPLEALAAGVPSVLLDTPVAREVFQEAALFVSAGDELGVTAAIRALLDYDTVRAHCLTRGRALVASYTWPRTATLTLAAIREAASA